MVILGASQLILGSRRGPFWKQNPLTCPLGTLALPLGVPRWTQDGHWRTQGPKNNQKQCLKLSIFHASCVIRSCRPCKRSRLGMIDMDQGSGFLNDLKIAPQLIDFIARFFLLVTMLSVLFHVRTLSFMYHVDEPYGASPKAGVLSSSRLFSISRSQQKFTSVTQSMIPRPHEKSSLGKRLCPCFHLKPYGSCCSLPRWSLDSPK